MRGSWRVRNISVQTGYYTKELADQAARDRKLSRTGLGVGFTGGRDQPHEHVVLTPRAAPGDRAAGRPAPGRLAPRRQPGPRPPLGPHPGRPPAPARRPLPPAPPTSLRRPPHDPPARPRPPPR